MSPAKFAHITRLENVLIREQKYSTCAVVMELSRTLGSSLQHQCLLWEALVYVFKAGGCREGTAHFSFFPFSARHFLASTSSARRTLSFI
ncbi:hypothetical protein LshimejAT787_0202410 [Lyophyllum shimeji]|uniref:Uncharacterized protein n=1 Tax=Lyophyllum shimeji TaxID=47721 RepID=A0A9P3UKS9_LYOSH|nr:hypothetical protein LshimejAT787_0202410 [Lyophyllum shimeji]